VPFSRSSELSNDFAITVDVIADVVDRLQSQGDTYDYICCIYPVTPLLRVERIEEAFEVMASRDWDYVFPAIEFPAPIERGFKKGASGIVEFVNLKYSNTRTQDIKKTFHDSGQFYLGKSEAWLERKPILNGHSTFIELAKNETLDIDDLEDWYLVEKLIEINKQVES
jgi:pseudaminic acid cytidylyltransferase